MRSLLCAIAVLGCLTRAAAATEDSQVENFRLLDHNGASHELYRYADRKGVVLIIQGNGCPIFQKSVPELLSLRARFAARGIAFLLLNANPQDSRDSIARAAKEAGLDLPILLDPTQMIARGLGVTRTAEAFVIDPTRWRVVYRGAIDDRLYYGAEKPTAGSRYLEDALVALLAKRRPAVESSEAFGCLIHFEKGRAPDYVHDVARVLSQKCLHCHSSELGAAPLTSYHMARGWAPMIRETIRTGLMPPNAADPHAGSFRNNPALTPQEARVVLEWTQSGMPRGEGPDPLEAAVLARAKRWPVRQPDIVYEAEIPNRPERPEFPYRFITLDPNVARELRLESLHFRMEGPQSGLLHANIVVLKSGADVSVLKTDIADLAVWSDSLDYNPFLVPGLLGGPIQLVPQGSALILKIHYPYSAMTKPGTLRMKAGLYLRRDSAPAPRLRAALIDNRTFRIPPGDGAYPVMASRTFDRRSALHCIRFHMHRRSSSIKISARYPDGRGEDLLSVPYIDFHSNWTYYLSRPKTLPAGTVVTVKGVYDNSARNRNNPDSSRWVGVGPNDADEMLQAFLYYTHDDPASERGSRPLSSEQDQRRAIIP